MLTARNLLYTQKASFDAPFSSRSNSISKIIFIENHAIHSMLFICTRVFKFNKSFFFFFFFSQFRKINVKSTVKKTGILEKWYPGPGTSTGGTPKPRTWDPKMCKCLGGTQDPEPPNWEPGPGMSKYSSGIRDPGPPKWDPRPGPQNISVKIEASNFQC